MALFLSCLRPLVYQAHSSPLAAFGECIRAYGENSLTYSTSSTGDDLCVYTVGALWKYFKHYTEGPLGGFRAHEFGFLGRYEVTP